MNPTTISLVADEYIRLALKEDMPHGDLSTEAVCPEAARAEASLIAKQNGIIAGLDVFAHVFKILDSNSEVLGSISNGDEVKPGQLIATVRGDVRAILSGERTALNYLQRMSGIATKTQKMVEMLEGSKIKLVDTRKTVPCMRLFDKEAVRIGGGLNHRVDLSSAIMLKDNHINAAGGVRAAVQAARKRAPITCVIEVEAESLEMALEATEAGADIIMLDNMDLDQMSEAIDLISGRSRIEISGNVDEHTIATLAGLGADYISCGALTHSVEALDLSLKNLRLLEGDYKL